jgi:hypothetical protein
MTRIGLRSELAPAELAKGRYCAMDFVRNRMTSGWRLRS